MTDCRLIEQWSCLTFQDRKNVWGGLSGWSKHLVGCVITTRRQICVRFVASQRVNFNDCVFITQFPNLIKDGLFSFGANQLTAAKLTLLLRNTGEEIFASSGTFKSSAFHTHPNLTGAVRGHAGRVSRTPGGAGTPTPTAEGDLKGSRSSFNLRNAAEPYFTRRCCLTLSW